MYNPKFHYHFTTLFGAPCCDWRISPRHLAAGALYLRNFSTLSGHTTSCTTGGDITTSGYTFASPPTQQPTQHMVHTGIAAQTDTTSYPVKNISHLYVYVSPQLYDFQESGKLDNILMSHICVLFWELQEISSDFDNTYGVLICCCLLEVSSDFSNTYDVLICCYVLEVR